MEWSKTRLISSLDSLRVIWLEAVAVSVRLWLLVSRLEERSRRVLKNGCSRQSSKEPATKSVRFRLSPSQGSGLLLLLASSWKDEKPTWKGNEWQGLLFACGCCMYWMACEVEISFSPQKVSSKMLVLVLQRSSRLRCWWFLVELMFRSQLVSGCGAADNYHTHPPAHPIYLLSLGY